MVRTGIFSAARIAALGAAIASALLSACGSDSPTAAIAAGNSRGTLIQDPPVRVASLDVPTFTAQLNASSSGQGLVALAGAPTCGVDFYYFQYWTVGAKNEAATASGALMVPTAAGAASAATQCSGARPIVLYGHGTTVDKNYNIANIADTTNSANGESALIAAVYAAHGYIVVAPNFAGYDTSSLPYHPWLNADQNSKDMMDALAAARTALPDSLTTATTDSGQLFVTGYSAGGYAAMATLRAMVAAGKTVTASAPASGPYATEAIVDAVFLGDVNLGSTEFAPLLVRSYQEAYGNVYQAPTDIYAPQFASGVALQLPSPIPLQEIYQEGGLPETALFSSTPPVSANPAVNAVLAMPPPNPIAAAGFGNPFLITNDFRLAYVEDALASPDGAVPTAQPGVPVAASPQFPLRANLRLNDMRYGPAWAPASPTLLCGGDQDPTVFFSVNTGTMATYWAAAPQGLITVLDMNGTPASGDPFAALQLAFQQQLAATVSAQGQLAAAEGYHTSVAPFCAVAARSFFSQF